jgi:hypothetical protein
MDARWIPDEVGKKLPIEHIGHPSGINLQYSDLFRTMLDGCSMVPD